MIELNTLFAFFVFFCSSYPNEKVVGWFNFRTPALLIRDPDIIHKILVTDFNAFRNNDLDMDEDADPILGRNIFVLKDELYVSMNIIQGGKGRVEHL